MQVWRIVCEQTWLHLLYLAVDAVQAICGLHHNYSFLCVVWVMTCALALMHHLSNMFIICLVPVVDNVIDKSYGSLVVFLFTSKAALAKRLGLHY